RDGRPLSWEKPENLSSLFKNHRWRKYLTNLAIPRNRRYLKPYADYLCRRWNRRHPSGPAALERFEICFIQEPTLPGNRTGPLRKLTLAAHRCFVWRDRRNKP
ncbi:MAG TPA: HTTM domain-containing protein, partial [Candidatus Eisenbacteria bacterium]|nr:HTTM domain-containing protein [Candidatus Eisenbacteria bacterium]